MGRLRFALAIAISIVLGSAALPSHAQPKGGATHTVAEGQSLWKISKRYNVSVEAIQLANDLGDKPIQPGDVLKIPSRAEAKKLVEAKQKKQDKAAPSKPPTESSKAATPDKGEKGSKNEKWWLEKPTSPTQTQKNPDDRGGINPCLTPDPGWGIYKPWSRSISMGQMTLPHRGGVTKAGRFDVVFHFHGHEPARKEFVKVMDGAVLVGVTLGIGSGAYSSAFASPQAFKDLVASTERAVARERGLPSAKVRKVALSAWSAGYGAVEQILGQKLGRDVVDTVLLLDGLHAGYAPGGGLNEAQLGPFVEFAQKAKRGQKKMFVSHSSIIPPGYASTTETANYLVMKLGGSKPKQMKKRAADPMGLELNSRWDAGGFHVRGYDGNDKMDHCAHFGLLKDALKVHVKPRWGTQRGYGPPKADAPKPKPGKKHS